MLSQNLKIKNSKVRTANFGIPAFQSRSGLKTCPNAGICAASCYAKQGFFNFSNVADAYEKRLAFTKSKDFVSIMTFEIERKRLSAMRWNDSGDFYSLDYLRKAFRVMRRTPDVKHYAYTKQVKLLKSVEKIWPRNFTVIFSLGGKQDALIDLKNDRHARVFDSRDELRFSGYADASIDDSIAWRSSNHKIGLVYHGQRKNSFNIAQKKRRKREVMELTAQQKRVINRSLKAAALESAAKEFKETEKAKAIEILGVTAGKFESNCGVIQSQERTELDWNMGELEKLIMQGTIPLTLFLQHVKANASLKTVLGEAMTEKVTFKRPVTYWLLKPNETTKAQAFASLENIE